jgi:hypothetical protein
MTYRGTVRGGVVVLDGEPTPPEGSAVEVRIVETDSLPTWGDVFKDLIGSGTELPADIAENHDHYIHGAPKGIDSK